MFADLAAHLWPSSEPLLNHNSSVHAQPTLDAHTEFETIFEEEVLDAVLSRVILFNDSIHTFDEVIAQVCKAVGCSDFDAEGLAWEAHVRGQALVFEGDLLDCLNVSSVLEEIALHTQVMA
jgi:ATP-dependent Clp protease adaptor protein ClpS